MSAAFRDYEADYQSQLDSIRKDIKTIAHSLTESRNATNAVFNRHDVVKRLFEQHSRMKGSLAHMELESNEGSVEQRAQCKQRLADMKREAFRLEKEINRLKQESAAADRADLLRRAQATRQAEGGGGNDAAGAGAGAADDGKDGPKKGDTQLAQVAENTGTLHRGTRTLTQALQYVVRMNEHGEATIVELKRQDETTDRVAGTTAETDVELSGAQRLLRTMKMTAMKNQMILAAVIILLIVMIVAILYYRFGRPIAMSLSGDDGDAPSSSPKVGPPVVGAGSPSVVTVLDGFVKSSADAASLIQSMIP